MRPSQNVMALVRAFDLETPPAKTNKEFKMQSIDFLDSISPIVDDVYQLICSNADNKSYMQNRFDALLSIAMDVGVETILCTELPVLLGKKTNKSSIKRAILSIPSFNDMLRPEMKTQLQLYGMPICSRRHYETMLFFGQPCFTMQRVLDSNGNIVYSPAVLHPFLQFLCASSMKKS